LVPDTRQPERAEALAGPGCRDTQPARAELVDLLRLAEPFPEEVNLDAAVLVGLDLVAAAGADDHRRLGAADDRLGRRRFGAVDAVGLADHLQLGQETVLVALQLLQV